MSFERLNKTDLLSVADEFGVDEVDNNNSKAEIIAALDEMGVTWDMAKKLDEHVAAEDAVVQQEEAVQKAEQKENEEKVLLKMTRRNPTYEIRGYRFTKDHPFGIVAQSDAEFIVDNIPGFSYASPREAQEYYG